MKILLLQHSPYFCISSFQSFPVFPPNFFSVDAFKGILCKRILVFHHNLKSLINGILSSIFFWKLARWMSKILIMKSSRSGFLKWLMDY